LATTATGNRSNAQLFALVFGVVYVAIGLIGFAVTGMDNFASGAEPGEKLIIFAINPLHNIAHLGVGALFLAGSRTHEAAKTVNLIIGVVYLLLGVLGLADILVDKLINNNSADTFLHLATGALGIYFGTAGATAGARTRTA
jgi:hypothetical protein